MIYQNTRIGYAEPIDLVGIRIDTNNIGDIFQLGDKNPNKPPKKKQKKKKKAMEEPPLKRKRRKARLKSTV